MSKGSYTSSSSSMTLPRSDFASSQMLSRPPGKPIGERGAINSDAQSQSLMASQNQPIQEEDSGDSYGNEKKEEEKKQDRQPKRKSWRQKAKIALHKLFLPTEGGNRSDAEES